MYLQPALTRAIFDNPNIVPPLDIDAIGSLPCHTFDPDDPPPLTNAVAIELAKVSSYRVAAAYAQCNDNPLMRFFVFEDGCRSVVNVRQCRCPICVQCQDIRLRKLHRTWNLRISCATAAWLHLVTLTVPMHEDPFATRDTLRRYVPANVPTLTNIAYDQASNTFQVRALIIGPLSQECSRRLYVKFLNRVTLRVLPKEDTSTLLDDLFRFELPPTAHAQALYYQRVHNRNLVVAWSKQHGDLLLSRSQPDSNKSKSPTRFRMTCQHGKRVKCSTAAMHLSDIVAFGRATPFFLEPHAHMRN